jgi:hypothetical protein
MNNKLKVLLSVVAMSFVMVGCGSGSDSTTAVKEPAPILDNSKLADGENRYGYYGEKVIFGDTIAVGGWTLSGGEEPISIELEADDTCVFVTELGWFPGDYGISKDGLVMMTGSCNYNYEDGKYEIVETLNNDCYNIDFYSDGQVLDRKLCKTRNGPKPITPVPTPEPTPTPVPTPEPTP